MRSDCVRWCIQSLRKLLYVLKNSKIIDNEGKLKKKSIFVLSSSLKNVKFLLPF